MSPIISIVVWTVLVTAVHGSQMFAWWLRLRWQIQQENARRQYLVTIAHALPRGGQIVEERSDGTWLRLGIAPGPRTESDDG